MQLSQYGTTNNELVELYRTRGNVLPVPEWTALQISLDFLVLLCTCACVDQELTLFNCVCLRENYKKKGHLKQSITVIPT